METVIDNLPLNEATDTLGVINCNHRLDCDFSDELSDNLGQDKQNKNQSARYSPLQATVAHPCSGGTTAPPSDWAGRWHFPSPPGPRGYLMKQFRADLISKCNEVLENIAPNWLLLALRHFYYSCIKDWREAILETGNNQNDRTFGMSVLSSGVKGWSYCQTRCEEHLNDGRMGSWTQVGNIRVATWCVSTGSISARGGTVAIMSNTNRVHIMWLIGIIWLFPIHKIRSDLNTAICLRASWSLHPRVFTWFFIFSAVFPSLLSIWPLKWIPKWGRPLSAVSSWSPWQQDGTPLMRLPAGSWTSPSWPGHQVHEGWRGPV